MVLARSNLAIAGASLLASTAVGVAYGIASQHTPPLPEEVAALAWLGIWHPLEPIPGWMSHSVGILVVGLMTLLVGLVVGRTTRRFDSLFAVVATLAMHPSTYAFSTHLRYTTNPEADGSPTLLGAAVALATALGVYGIGYLVQGRYAIATTACAVGILAFAWIPAIGDREQISRATRQQRFQNLSSTLELIRSSPSHRIFLIPECDAVDDEARALIRATDGHADVNPESIPMNQSVTLAGIGPVTEDGVVRNLAPEVRTLGTIEAGELVTNTSPDLRAISVRTSEDEPVFSARLAQPSLESPLVFLGIATDSIGRVRLIARELPSEILEIKSDGLETTVGWRPSWRASKGQREFRWESGELLPLGGSLRWTFALVKNAKYHSGVWKTIYSRQD